MLTCLLTALLTGTLLFAFGGPIISQTFIDAGKQFVLGGGQRGAFRVAAHNVGPVPVSVAERRADGSLHELGRLEPGQRTELAFAAGSAALVRNLGEHQAVLDFRVTGRTSGLGMGYEGLRK
ncbi:hypothetical protein E4631_05995 [Hymenobacter sp. UV11]|uniref:hypothetical protein n=1 Tax=Hymenobacter sp. UV11 TaxID=1849735 RepID=UPI00105C9AF1|nr:hypothetical protein [Hymenobacter sp. UV11]TDN38285.1 hypothetical protein A8B98_25115 [Hymenobacter sp. UV11]TFZ67530.1 hypothetical protein E4631_05995 [Hymenobacter sp. UV11]